MNQEQLQTFCQSFNGVTSEFPFDDVTLVCKVMGKMFAIIPLDVEEASISLKCDPEKAIELREQHEDIIEGYHLNKKHWNTVYCERGLPTSLLKELIVHSYDLVIKSLSKATQVTLKSM
ncbi:MAG: MmcQ/YjbR family DNA-binding protein [Saprospiraceae bacterium]